MTTQKSKTLLSNLDLKMTPAEIKKIEHAEKRKARIDESYKKAEVAEREGTEAPDVIYSALQEGNHYTEDPVFDKSREAIADMRSLPIKQYEVGSEGDFAIRLAEGSAALDELQKGVFCHACHDRIPEMPELWELAMTRLEERIGPRPEGTTQKDMCCYCGARRGVEGDVAAPSILTPTPDQMNVLQTMFGGIKERDA